MDSVPKKSSVVVVGGGPSGTTCAILLAQAGVDVVLFDKEKFPRYKVGESIIPHIWKFTDMLGVSDKIVAANFIKKGGGFALWDGVLTGLYFNKHGYTRPGMHVERDEFDNILLERCKEVGVQVFEETKVSKVDIKENENILFFQNENTKEKGSISAKYLIDASGQNALVSKQEGMREWDDDFKFQAFWAYFDQSDYLNPEGKVIDFKHRRDITPMSLTSTTGHWGWVWNLVLREKVSVGALVPRSELEKFKKGGSTLEERFMSHINHTPLTSSLLEKGKLISEIRTIRDYAYQPQKLSFNNCYLIGDAASFADPINSEGVTMALYGGFLAAHCIEKSLTKEKRKQFFQDLYINTMQRRFDLFKVLSYPSKQIPKELLDSVKNMMLNQSWEENSLILDHLIATGRANDFADVLQEVGISVKEMCQEVPLPIAV